MQLLETRLLPIYLRDHQAGATAGLELARRARDQNVGTRLGDFLAALAIEVEEDLETLLEVMEACGCEPDPLKSSAAWIGERLGRLKPNGRLRGYSPLSRLVELEGLYAAASGKLSLWENLEQARREELERFDLPALAERARSQRERVQTHRLAAAAEALGSG